MSENKFKERDGLSLTKIMDLRYGENPHQASSLYGVNGDGFPLKILQGKGLSYTNLLDLYTAWQIVNQFDEKEPTAAIVKHANPCGVGQASTIRDAYRRALETDLISAYGGIVGLNNSLDENTASAIIGSQFIECVIAPDVKKSALVLLARKPNLRVVITDQTTFGPEYRSVFGSILVQEPDTVAEAREPWPTWDLRVVSKRQPSPREWEQLRFAWRVCAFVKSNGVIMTRDEIGTDLPNHHTYGIGGGQPNRADSAKIAGGHLQSQLRKNLVCVAASDAFIPFPDTVEVLASAGVTAIVQTGGSKGDEQTTDRANEYNMAMVYTGYRHFRH